MADFTALEMDDADVDWSSWQTEGKDRAEKMLSAVGLP